MFQYHGSNNLGLHVVKALGNKRRLQIEITIILTVCCLSQRFFCLGSVRSGAAELILNSTTYIQIQGLLPSIPALYVPETSLVEE